MGDGTAKEIRTHAVYVRDVERLLEENGYRPVRDDKIGNTYGIDGAAAWRTTLATARGLRAVDLVLPPGFPFAKPRVGVNRLPDEHRPFAHVEGTGLLCLDEQDAPHEIAPDGSAVLRALERAIALLGKEDKDLADERKAEFRNYWSIGAGGKIYSLLDPQTPFGVVSSWDGPSFTLVARDDEQAQLWAGRFLGTKPKAPFQRALYLPGENLSDQLQSGTEVMLRAGPFPEVVTELEGVAKKWRPSTAVVFRLPGDFALVGGWLRRPQEPQKMVVRGPHAGFRPGRMPKTIAIERYFGPYSVFQRADLQRADAPWVLARGGEEFNETLFCARVCVIGAGALGSGVARLLIKAGIGHVVIVDPDILTWDNIARHDLGAQYVGQSKAEALAARLMEDYPFADVRGIGASWQEVYEREPALFNAEVVVSTTASWPDEAKLNALYRKGRLPGALIFGWLEAHAAAAQVLIVGRDGGCLACGMSADGAFAHAATEWPHHTIRSEPACGTTFAPYADLNATRARALIAREIRATLLDMPVTSRLAGEIYDMDSWHQYGGTVSPLLMKTLGRNPNAHGDCWTANWPKASACGFCKQ